MHQQWLSLTCILAISFGTDDIDSVTLLQVGAPANMWRRGSKALTPDQKLASNCGDSTAEQAHAATANDSVLAQRVQFANGPVALSAQTRVAYHGAAPANTGVADSKGATPEGQGVSGSGAVPGNTSIITVPTQAPVQPQVPNSQGTSIIADVSATANANVSNEGKPHAASNGALPANGDSQNVSGALPANANAVNISIAAPAQLQPNVASTAGATPVAKDAAPDSVTAPAEARQQPNVASGTGVTPVANTVDASGAAVPANIPATNDSVKVAMRAPRQPSDVNSTGAATEVPTANASLAVPENVNVSGSNDAVTVPVEVRIANASVTVPVEVSVPNATSEHVNKASGASRAEADISNASSEAPLQKHAADTANVNASNDSVTIPVQVRIANASVTVPVEVSVANASGAAPNVSGAESEHAHDEGSSSAASKKRHSANTTNTNDSNDSLPGDVTLPVHVRIGNASITVPVEVRVANTSNPSKRRDESANSSLEKPGLPIHAILLAVAAMFCWGSWGNCILVAQAPFELTLVNFAVGSLSNIPLVD